MPAAHLLLIVVLSALGLLGSAWLALFAIVQAQNRMIREHKRSLEAERRATLTRQAFMDNAHHELRTPLQIILGNLDILGTLSQDPLQAELVARTQASATRLHCLVQGLLDLTDLADGTYPLHPVAVDLAHLLETFASEARHRAESKGLRFETEWDFTPQGAWVDPGALTRIIGSLMDNAIAYTDEGGILLRAGTEVEGRALVFYLELDDTGRGLPEDRHGALLEPLRHDRHPLSQAGSLGLGLPLAASLTRHLGGELTLARLFPGTRARLEIPLPMANL
jgi:signal transduction histidine kinase